MVHLGSTSCDAESRPRGAFRTRVTVMSLILATTACDSTPFAVLLDEVRSPGPDSSVIALSAGSIGLVIDVREIFKKGYFPTEVDITFPDQPAQSATLAVDPLTNLAILRLDNDSLTATQRVAFASGVPASIVVRDSGDAELGRLEDDQTLNASNAPLSVGSSGPRVPRPLRIVRGRPLLLLNEVGDGAVIARLGVTSTRTASSTYTPLSPTLQQFVFTYDSIGAFYTLRQGTVVFCQRDQEYVLDLRTSCPNHPEGGTQVPARFEVEQEGREGWFRLVVVNTYGSNITSLRRTYAGWGTDPGDSNFGALVLMPPRIDGTLAPDDDRRSHFRLLSDQIDWTVVDRGTAFNQPIMPPARLDFAYQATLSNCSPATLTETIGRTQTRTRTTTFGTSESVQVLSSTRMMLGAKIGAEAGVDVAGLGEVKVTAELSAEMEFSTAVTVASGNTFEQAVAAQEEVSRTRELVLPPFTAVVASDYVRTISNVITPFTQTFRVRARYKSDGPVLSGEAIIDQLSSNRFEGLVTKVGPDYVDFTIRGQAFTNQFFQAESTVSEKVGGCR